MGRIRNSYELAKKVNHLKEKITIADTNGPSANPGRLNTPWPKSVSEPDRLGLLHIEPENWKWKILGEKTQTASLEMVHHIDYPRVGQIQELIEGGYPLTMTANYF